MSQTIYSNIVASTTSGNQLAVYLNDFKDAVASGFSGTSRPVNLQAGGYWIDTTNGPTTWAYKLWTGSINITVLTFNLASGTVSVAGIDGQFSLSKTSADAVGPILDFLKERIAGNGQTLIGDSLGDLQFKGTDNAGNPVMSGRVRVISQDDAISTEFGAYLSFEFVDQDTSTLSEKMRLDNGNLGVGTSLPEARVHVKGGTGIRAEIQADSTVGSSFTGRKKRIAGSGQVLANDLIFSLNANSTDDANAEVLKAFTIEVSASENHTATAQGTKVELKTKDTGSATATTKILIQDGLEFPLGAKSTSLVVGSNATANTNVKLHRSAAGKISAVLGGDSTSEGTEPTTLAQLAHIVERFTTAGKPANAVANTGRIIYVTDTNKFEYDTGSAWAGLGGGALITSVQAAVVAGTGITISGTDSRRLIKVTGNASGENDLSAATLQIAAGVNDGDEIIISGQSLDNYVVLRKLDTFKGVKVTADWTSFDGKICLVWNSTASLWEELYRVTY